MDKSKIKKYIKEYLPFTLFVILIIGIRVFICTPINVSGNSMSSTLKDGDIMLLNKLSLKDGIDRFDIVVVKTETNYIIKRVIGLPGETISYKDGVLYINGKVYEDKYNLTGTNDIDPVKILDNEYYVGALTNILTNPTDVIDFSNQKVVTNSKRETLLISRSPIPYPKGTLDFEYEKGMARINASVVPQLSTLFLTPPPELENVSSSLIRGFLGQPGWQHWVSPHVPQAVLSLLNSKFPVSE